jgi:ParB family chromosome partitioning protein
MGKRDELLKAGGANILSSMGAGQGSGLPAGLDPATAMKKPAHLEGLSKERAAARIAIDRIVRDEDQPRTEFDAEELARLSESLKTRGQLQPIRVRWDEGRGAYVLILGERRWRAARMAGLAELSCIVHEAPLDPNDRLAIQLIENCLRSDLQPIEQARAYRRLMEVQGWSARQLAAELAINPATVTRALALLDLPEAVQEQVEAGWLAPHTAYEVTKLERPEDQAVVAQAAVEQRLTRTEVDELVRAVRARKPAPEAKPQPVTVDLGDGTVVTIRWKKANDVAPVQALRRAMRQIQDQERARDDQAA